MAAYVALIAVGLIVFGAGVAESEAPGQRAAESPATQDVAGLQKGCEAGKASDCKTLGDVYRDGAGVANMARAAAFYKQACDGRDSHGCYTLALLYMEGTGVPKDPTRAAALFKQSCDAGIALACSTLGLLYDQGTGVPKDPMRALALWDQACQQGESTIGCYLFESRMRESAERRQPSEKVCVRHILVKVESPPREPAGHAEAKARSRAQAILTSLRAGTDFAKLARKLSEDAVSASHGGDIGCFSRGVMVREFEDVAFALKVGETSDLVRTSFGFHVIQRVTKAER